MATKSLPKSSVSSEKRKTRSKKKEPTWAEKSRKGLLDLLKTDSLLYVVEEGISGRSHSRCGIAEMIQDEEYEKTHAKFREDAERIRSLGSALPEEEDRIINHLLVEMEESHFMFAHFGARKMFDIVRLQREWDIWGTQLRDSWNRC